MSFDCSVWTQRFTTVCISLQSNRNLVVCLPENFVWLRLNNNSSSGTTHTKETSHHVNKRVWKPHFINGNMGFTWVNIIFLISTQKHRLWLLVRTVPMKGFYQGPTAYIWSKNTENMAVIDYKNNIWETCKKAFILQVFVNITYIKLIVAKINI